MTSPPHTLQVGDTLLGRYTLMRPLGAGGYSTVFAAHDAKTQAHVAIKILKVEGDHQDPSALGRLRQEAMLLRQLSHPNILRIFDFFPLPHGAFLSMELLQGRNLAQLLYDDGPAHSERALPLIKQLLSALETAHTHKILHRDLKPENILICPSPQGNYAKLVDFGLAKNYAAQGLEPNEFGLTMVKTRAGGFLGTPRYAAPEQAVGDAVGPYTDLFSLGLVIAEWLTGAYRLKGDTHAELLRGLVSGEPVDLMDCPDAWRAWLRRILDKDPASRYQTATEALEELATKVEPAIFGARHTGDFVFHEATKSYVWGLDAEAPDAASFLDHDDPLELDLEGVEATQFTPHTQPTPPAEPTVTMGFVPQETILTSVISKPTHDPDPPSASTLLIVGALSCFSVLSLLIILYLMAQ